jgi:hypothetical protein
VDRDHVTRMDAGKGTKETGEKRDQGYMTKEIEKERRRIPNTNSKKQVHRLRDTRKRKIRNKG